MTFKVGDKVRVRESDWPDIYPVGSERVILKLRKDVSLAYLGSSHAFWYSELELVEDDVTEDLIKHPSHYAHVPGVECKDVVGHFNYNKGTAIAYIWRSAHKGAEVQDLEKAITHLEFELELLKAAQS